MTKKRKRANVKLGPDLDGRYSNKWVSAYSVRDLEAEKDRVKRGWAAEQEQERARRASLVNAANTGHMAYRAAEEALPMVQTFKEYASTWFELYKKPHVRLQTCRMYENILDNHLYPTFGEKPLNVITKNDLQGFILRYKEKSSSLIDKVMVVLRQVFDAAEEDELIRKSPVKRLVPPEGTKGERLPISLEAVEAATNALHGSIDALLPMVMIYAGLRRGEALGLRWGDVRDGCIYVERGVVFDGNKSFVGPPKSKAAFRSIPVFAPLDAAFLLHVRGDDEEYIFGPELWTQAKYKRTWERIQRIAPILEGVTAHQLRHTFLLLLRRAGVDEATQQYLMGHSEYETTVNDYTHIEETDIENARQKIGEKLPQILNLPVPVTP